MTEIMGRKHTLGVLSRLAARIPRLPRQLSDCVHRDSDALAREHGWSITATTGWFGFGTRVYRDPRFAARMPGADDGDPIRPDTRAAAMTAYRSCCDQRWLPYGTRKTRIAARTIVSAIASRYQPLGRLLAAPAPIPPSTVARPLPLRKGADSS
jgi:hypothetical protein